MHKHEPVNRVLAIVGAATIFGGVLAVFSKSVEALAIRVITGTWAHNGQTDLFSEKI